FEFDDLAQLCFCFHTFARPEQVHSRRCLEQQIERIILESAFMFFLRFCRAADCAEVPSIKIAYEWRNWFATHRKIELPKGFSPVVANDSDQRQYGVSLCKRRIDLQRLPRGRAHQSCAFTCRDQVFGDVRKEAPTELDLGQAELRVGCDRLFEVFSAFWQRFRIPSLKVKTRLQK